MFNEIIPQSAIILSLVGIIVILGRKFPKACELKIEATPKREKGDKKFFAQLGLGFKKARSLFFQGAKVGGRFLYFAGGAIGRKSVSAWRQHRVKAQARKAKKERERALASKEMPQPKVTPPRETPKETKEKPPSKKPAPKMPPLVRPTLERTLPQPRLTQRLVKAKIAQAPAKMEDLDIDQLLTRAQRFAKVKSFGQAEKMCLEVIRKDSHVSRVYKILGCIYFQQGNFDDAQRSLREALKRGIDEIDVYKKLGQCYVQGDKSKEAIKIYRRAIKNNRAKEYFYLELGKILRNSGQQDKAIRAYQDLVREYPGNYKYTELLEKQKKLRDS